ncbi:hypothetical protein MGG_15595 [Pyricularia oryzae 70-15]|uniref:Uncharacterized protein n=3 Tax=Pyricularia oryzae TaxID=318829 RepID=G4MV47_PYRO7|nr:uncharacterized protein MGG_15595 [Pyricularia oryzae 70-15]EHA54062.1 hypothetical protein MGG_15595 [Pyricularia oryzae 70-15]ELQ42140.1 hypothetical protein OOU_Y34scaffold00228g31 [Pyricularia oryzae Y34]
MYLLGTWEGEGIRESRLPEAAAGHVGFLEGPDPGSHPGPDQTEHAPYLQKLVPV